ncbi:MAG: VCBS repeat-containing protein [bacterium]|nr:VCBS repeat-containing protein [bacterium]
MTLRRWPVQILLLTGVLLAGGAGAGKPHPGAESPVASATRSETVALPARERPATLAQTLSERFDASRDRWDTEVLNVTAGKQLKALGALLAGGRPPALAKVSPLIAPDFTCSPLRPARLTTVSESDLFEVRRWQAPPETSREPAAAPHHGAAGLAQALRVLQDGLGGEGDVHTKFKIVRIESSESVFTTRIRLEASRLSATGSRQLVAGWRGRWQVPRAGEPPRLLSIELESYEEVSVRGRPLFADVTASALGHNDAYRTQVLPGIDHWLGRVSRIAGMSLFGHHGLAVADVNGDGLEDLYACEAGGLPNRLYLQNPDGTATDASAAAGVDWLEWTPSALLIDLDNDGDQDLAAATRRWLLLAENDGGGRFALKRRLSRVVASPASLAAADYDGDGNLDLYVCGYDGDPENRGLPGPFPYHDAENGGRNALLRNMGDFELEDVTDRVGLGQNNTRFSFAAAWEDADNDGDMDLYVANDFGRNNLYLNDRGRFTDVAPAAGAEDVASGMSVAWGDADRDGWMDLYVGNMFSSAGGRVAYQRAFSESTGSAAADLRRMARGNSLFLNAGSRAGGNTFGFRDASEVAGVTMGRWAWSSKFADLDNDGWQDLVVANGYVSNEDSGDL